MRPQSSEDWANLVRQQEAMHRATELKWRSALVAATAAMKQTQDSLGALHNDIEPDSELVTNILDKIYRAQVDSSTTSSATDATSIATSNEQPEDQVDVH